MANTIPKEVKKEIVDAWIAEVTWKVALFQNTSNCLTQSLYTGCTNEATPGVGYTTGGATLAGRAGGYVDTDKYYLDATDVQWLTSTFSNIQYIVVYETTGNKIRFIYDLTSTYSVTSGTFTVQWATPATGGLVKVQ